VVSGQQIALPLRSFTDTAAVVAVPLTIPTGNWILRVEANSIFGGRVVSVHPNSAPATVGQALTVLEDGTLPVTLVARTPMATRSRSRSRRIPRTEC